MREFNPAELGAREAIREVLKDYVLAVDRRDWDTIRSCYHADAFDDHGHYSGGLDGFIEHFVQAITYWVGTAHYVYAGDIELEGHLARCVTPTIAHHWKGENALVMGVRYLDRFERRDDDWRIARRTVVLDWVSKMPARRDTWTDSSIFPLGDPGPADPIHDPSFWEPRPVTSVEPEE